MAAAPLGAHAPLAPTDEDLVGRVAQGDRSAFDSLYARYFQRVYRFVDRRLRNRADVEETVQEVFFHLFNSLSGFRGDAPFAAWVFGVTRRTLASRFKRRRVESVPLGEDEPDGLDPLASSLQREPDPHQVYEYNERLARLAAAIECDLSAEQWQLFQLHHLENRSIQEIARETSKSEDAVKSHLYRARRLLLAR
jgi:RNA polymerase sigma-70 factor (ECF subfamily)